MPITGSWFLDLILGLGALSVAAVAILKAFREGWALLKAAWRTINRLNEVADDYLGDKAKGIPAMKDRVVALEKFQRDDLKRVHAAWHTEEPQPYPNGTPRRRR